MGRVQFYILPTSPPPYLPLFPFPPLPCLPFYSAGAAPNKPIAPNNIPMRSQKTNPW
jgi:hypothetical protein